MSELIYEYTIHKRPISQLCAEEGSGLNTYYIMVLTISPSLHAGFLGATSDSLPSVTSDLYPSVTMLQSSTLTQSMPVVRVDTSKVWK